MAQTINVAALLGSKSQCLTVCRFTLRKPGTSATIRMADDSGPELIRC